MLKKRFLRDKGVLAAAASIISIAALLSISFLGDIHNHQDFKSHDDCTACQWQASFLSLAPDGIVAVGVAAISFLTALCPLLDVSRRPVGQLAIRAPPVLRLK